MVGLLAGAAFGAMLAIGESAAAYSFGDRFTARWLAFLLLYYAPTAAIAGVVAALLGGGQFDVESTMSRVAVALIGATASGFAAVAMAQEFLPGGSLAARAGVLLVGMADGVAAMVIIRSYVQKMTHHTLAIAVLTLVPATLAFTWCAILEIPSRLDLLWRAALMAVAPLATMTAAVTGLARSPPNVRRFLTLMITSMLGIVCAWGEWSYVDRTAFFRDDHQPIPSGPRGDRSPSVVVIVLDAARARSFSCYGYARRTTPNIDAFARSATRFGNCITPGPWSLPGHAALLTGLAFPANLARGPGSPPLSVPDSVVTLAEILSARGYATAGIVANYSVLAPVYHLDQGFRRYDGFSGEYRRISYTPLLHRFQGVVPYPLLRYPLSDWFPSYRSAADVTRTAERWLASLPPGQPFYLFLNYLDVHVPYTARGRFRDAWGARSSNHRFPTNDINGYESVAAGMRPLSDEERVHLVNLNDAALSYLDDQVGGLLRFLDALPGTADTWIIVTADHGDAIGEHGHVGHDRGDLYQEVLHVPLIVRPPAGTGSMTVGMSSRPTELFDIVPTLLEHMHVSAPTPLEGIPLGRPRERVYAEALGGAMIIERGMKYIHRSNGHEEVYDLEVDPLEQHPLPNRGSEVVHLRDRLRDWLSTRQTVPLAGTASPVDDARERLRALGYGR